jgi:GMP synthase (glutamine-hydrolysing)
MEKIGIVDFGGQYTHLIARRIRQLGVYSEVLASQSSAEEIKGFSGFIFSGGPSSVYDPEAPTCSQALLESGLPILGLCYGHQLISHKLGGEVKPGKVHEFGQADFHPDRNHPLFAGLSPTSTVWMSHGDEVVKLPSGFRSIGNTSDCALAAVANDAKHIYGVQFHPEVTHSIEGLEIFKNFLKICGCKFEWKVSDYILSLEAKLKAQCEGRKVFLLVSGGVDSTVAFALLNKALGPDRVLGLHIDNGLMRKNESDDVLEFMNREGFHNLKVRDATDDFLRALKGLHAPEAKRKAIGDTFLTVKDQALAALELNPEEWLLAQGTIYPDTIESGGTKHASVIKTHHNRVGAILELLAKGLVVEPLADLYKDEVRELGLLLGIPPKLIWRHPFPGPGLGVRLLCSTEFGAKVDPAVTEKVGALLKAQGLQGQILPVESVGVQGDARTYAHPCLIQGTRDWELGDKISTTLTNRIREVNRVVLQIGALPTGEYTPIAAECVKSRLDFLREIDDLCTDFLIKQNLYASIWQMPVVLLPLEKAGKPVIVLRPVVSSEAMTARFATLPFPLLDQLWENLKHAGVGALIYDITHKPPGTIEWE